MLLAVVRHAESTENAPKYSGFYQDPRPWTGSAAHALSRDLVGLTPRGFLQCQWLRTAIEEFVGRDPYVCSSPYRRALDTVELVHTQGRGGIGGFAIELTPWSATESYLASLAR